MNWLLLKNSLLVSGLTTLLSVGLGLAAAVWLSGLEGRSRTGLLVLGAATLALPPFVVTNCWLHYLGSTGVWRAWLPLNIVSLGGTVWILALLTWPITLFATWSAWRRLEPGQLESDPAVSGWVLMRALLWPLARTSLAQAALVTFVLALNNFAVPAILQVKVFPAEMWVRFNTTFDTLGALRLSWPLVAGPLLLVLFFMRQQVAWPHLESSASAKVFRKQLGGKWVWFCGVCTIGLCLVSIGLPIFQLASVQRTWTELPGAVAAGKLAIWNSFALAVCSATVVAGLGLVGGGRVGARKIVVLFWVPFLVPGVLLGIGLIQVFNRPSLSAIYQSSAIVIIAFVIRYLALGWSTVAHARGTVDRDLTDAAYLEGATRWQMLRFVLWPQIGTRVVAAWYVIFLLCLWDVESMILVVPPGGETLALRIFNLLHYGYNAQVNALCLTLLAIAVAPLALWGIASFLMQAKDRIANHVIAKAQSGSAASLFLASWALLALTGCGVGSKQGEAPLESRLFNRVQIIGSRGTGVGELNKPRSVVVDGRDNLYVVDMTGRVQKFSRSGTFLLSWQMPQTDLGKPKGMCRDQNGNVIVAEPHYQRVNHFSPDGKLVAQWGTSGTNLGQFKLPRAVAINSRGEIYVSEYGAAERVQRFSFGENASAPGASNALAASAPNAPAPAVRFLNSFGHAGNGPGEFNRPEGICIDAQDRVFVADSCNHRIQIFSSEGKFIRQYGKAGTGKGELSYPYDICVDGAGRQYVCEFGNSRIQVFDANDQPLEIIGGPGAEPGRFSNPWGVALDSVGNLYVADSQNHRVQKLIREPGTNTGRANSGSVANLQLGLLVQPE